MATLCLVQGCPVFNDIGPYISVLATDAHATVDSIYRGQDAEWLLNPHHHMSQRQLSDAWIAWSQHGQLIHGFTRENPPNPANLPGFSTHEKRSDGVAYPQIARGEELEWWMQGFDVNDLDCDRVIMLAGEHDWDLWRPYDSASEAHHLNFKSRPHLGPKMIDRIYRLRHTLPRS